MSSQRYAMCLPFILDFILTTRTPPNLITGTDRQGSHFRIRLWRPSRILHVPKSSKYGRKHTTSSLCYVDARKSYRSNTTRRRVSTVSAPNDQSPNPIRPPTTSFFNVLAGPSLSSSIMVISPKALHFPCPVM